MRLGNAWPGRTAALQYQLFHPGAFRTTAYAEPRRQRHPTPISDPGD